VQPLVVDTLAILLLTRIQNADGVVLSVIAPPTFVGVQRLQLQRQPLQLKYPRDQRKCKRNGQPASCDTLSTEAQPSAAFLGVLRHDEYPAGPGDAVFHWNRVT
jgi:hypothetical protein